MKHLISILLVAAFWCCGTAAEKEENHTNIRVWDERMEVIFESNDIGVIERIREIFSQSERLGSEVIPKSFSHKIDFESRWLYDPKSGTYQLLSKTLQPVWKLSNEGNEYIVSLIKKEGISRR
jgi:hypothetical protein